jgi:hypothetical protein
VADTDEGRKSEALRRFQPASGRKADSRQEAREAMAAELGNPERFAECLRAFSQLALILEPLRTSRFPADPTIAAILALDLADDLVGRERVAAMRQAVTPQFASLELAQACSAGVQAALDLVDEREGLLGLTAGGALCTSCIQEGARADHPFWEVIFELTLTETLLSGLFMIRVVQARPHEPDVGGAFARALAGERSRELNVLGVSASATELTQAYEAALHDSAPYNLQIDAVLHLAHTHAELVPRVGKSLALGGWTEDVRTQVLEGYDEAFARDVTPDLTKELVGWCAQRLETLRDDPANLEGNTREPAEEALRCAVSWLSLQELEPADNPLLRSIHLQSLAFCRVGASALEQAFVSKIWSQPDDTFALEEYERFLLQQREPTRSRRVARFRKWVLEQRTTGTAPS